MRSCHPPLSADVKPTQQKGVGAQYDIMGWEKNNCLINFKWVLIRREKAREIKDASRDTSYKLKSKLVVIPRNTQHVRGTVL